MLLLLLLLLLWLLEDAVIEGFKVAVRGLGVVADTALRVGDAEAGVGVFLVGVGEEGDVSSDMTMADDEDEEEVTTVAAVVVDSGTGDRNC